MDNKPLFPVLPVFPLFVQYRVLMANQIQLGSYESPGFPTSSGQESLIVECNGSVLAISDTHLIDPNGPELLSNHAPNNTMYGLYLFDRGQDTYFMLVRDQPTGAPEGGSFFPADGVAIIGRSSTWYTLRAAGRHGTAQSGGSWQFDAIQKIVFFPRLPLATGIEQTRDQDANPFAAFNVDLPRISLDPLRADQPGS